MKYAGRGGICVLCLALLAQTGCAQLPAPRELAQMTLMRTLGVDAEPAGAVCVTAAGGAQRGDAGAIVLHQRGQSISGACLALQQARADDLYYGHVGQLVLGEPLAARGVEDALAHLLHDPELRPDTAVYVVRGGTAADWLAGAAGLPAETGDFSPALPHTARTVLADAAENGSFLLPAVTPGGAGTAFAVFRDGALVGWADGDAAHGVALCLGTVGADIVELRPDGRRVALRVTGARTRVRPRFEGETLVGLSLRCTLAAQVAESSAGLNLRDAALRAALEEALEAVTRARIDAALALSQRLDADFMGLKAAAGRAAPWHRDAMRAQWDSAVLRFDVDVDARIG